MYYEINVSKIGEHLFATAPRSIPGVFALRKVLPVLMDKFPESEGYYVSVEEMQSGGRGLGPAEIAEILRKGPPKHATG